MRNAIILVIVGLCGCPPTTTPVVTVNPRLVENAATPEMVADLHRREAEYFARNSANPVKDADNVVPLVWECLQRPDSGTSYLYRTEIPEGWLVVDYGTECAVIVSDLNHTWRTNR